MSYFVNKTDGTAIVVLDGTKDTTSTSLTLFGRLVQNYGDQTNENFVHLLENFALAASPANPIVGQLWFDTTTNNIKAYTTDSTWVTVGSVIEGDVNINGNLELGSSNFTIKDFGGNIQLVDSTVSGNVSFYNNVAGTSTRVLHLNGATGLVEVNANATSNFGVTTKIYVDSEIQAATTGGDVNLKANVAIINANLAARVEAENDLLNRITGANAQIALRDTITRVNGLISDVNNSIEDNVNQIYANLAVRVQQTRDVEIAMLANVAAANARVDGANVSISDLSGRVDDLEAAVQIDIVTGLATKADIISPALLGTPTAPTAAVGTNNLQIATTQYVMNQSVYWDGSRKFVSTGDPSASDGNNGDIWFKYIP